MSIRARASVLLPLPAEPDPMPEQHDKVVDFSNAVLYVGALQTILAVTTASLVSILSCTLLPTTAVSAVRTLTLSSIIGGLIVRKPFSLGRVHGQVLIFNALRPAVALYIVTLVLEQLVHACARDAAAPSWRRLVVHVAIFTCIVSGFMRARKPLQETDLPFLITTLAMFCVAMLPPPAVLLAGPLCSQMTLAAGAERLARAFSFSLLYSVFVYSSAPPVHCSNEVAICMMRASAASVWTLGCHPGLLPLAALQIFVVLYVRINKDTEVNGYERVTLIQERPDVENGVDVEKSAIKSAEDAIRRFDEFTPPNVNKHGEVTESKQANNAENENPVPTGLSIQPTQQVQPVQSTQPPALPASVSLAGESHTRDVISPEFEVFGERGLVDISSASVAQTQTGQIADAARMAEIAKRLVESGT